MTRQRQHPPRSMFHGNELTRLLTMLAMLGVLLLLIVRAGDPSTWAWLVRDAGAVHQRNSPVSNENDANKPAQPETSARNGKSEAGSQASEGPTDLDPEEADAIKEEFQALTDGTEKIQPEEMPAYKREMRWVQGQALAEMIKRAKKNVSFNQFYQTPERYRGQLFEMDLTVYLIRKSDLKCNGEDLYEVWGATDESRTWLYDAMVIDLPKGMPVGREIYEKATLVGYFFKLQGYQPADAKPNAAPLKAPMFIGRLIWRPSAKPQALPSNWHWELFLLAGFIIFIIIRWGLLLMGRRRRLLSPSTIQVKSDANPVDEWLANTGPDDSSDVDK